MSRKEHKYESLPTIKTDYLLIGAGIMSATLGVLLKKLYPASQIHITERLGNCGLESSYGLNNAGTGHAGYCELNYTPLNENNEIDISKAVKVNKAFKKSLEFWQYLIGGEEIISDFLHPIPHYAFVQGEEDVKFLSMRHEAMKKEACFSDIQFSNDSNELYKWLPLVMRGRDKTQPVAATRANNGYDVDYGKLTDYLISYLEIKNVDITYNQEVIDLYKSGDKWFVIQRDREIQELSKIESGFVFIGAGGAAINLLEKSGIPSSRNYGGFPVSGEWLICYNPKIGEEHHAKVYGRPSEGSPPMSVPHLDARIINGRSCLLFGPFAGLSTKFLKFGSKWDFFKSIRFGNLWTMINAGLRNMPLNKYLFKELLKNDSDRFKVLQSYYPMAKKWNWRTLVAGQRVQMIKNEDGKGVIEFGTEIVVDTDGSLACLLGASPGASTSVKIMIDVLEKCFPFDQETKNKITEMIPSYN